MVQNLCSCLVLATCLFGSLLQSCVKMTWIKLPLHTIASFPIVLLCIYLQWCNLYGRKLERKKKQMRRVKSGNSKSLRSAWILFCTSVVSLKLYLCAYTLSALLHCQSCIFYSHLIHGRESDVASTLPRQAPTCVSTSLQHASILFLLALSVIFRFIVSVPPTTVDLTQVKQTNLSSNKALFSHLSFGSCSWWHAAFYKGIKKYSYPCCFQLFVLLNFGLLNSHFNNAFAEMWLLPKSLQCRTKKGLNSSLPNSVSEFF